MPRAMDGRIVRCGIISWCKSATTFEPAKAPMATSPTHIGSTMASTGRNFKLYTGRHLWLPLMLHGDFPVTQIISRRDVVFNIFYTLSLCCPVQTAWKFWPRLNAAAPVVTNS